VVVVGGGGGEALCDVVRGGEVKESSGQNETGDQKKEKVLTTRDWGGSRNRCEGEKRERLKAQTNF